MVQKLFALYLHSEEKYEMEDLSETLDIPQSTLRNWIMQGCERKAGSGRRLISIEFDNKLIEWCEEEKKKLKNNEIKLSKTRFLAYARKIAPKEMILSTGWFYKFQSRHSIAFTKH